MIPLAEELILKHRLVAILRLPDLSDAVPLAETLVRAGVVALEFTLTNPEAPKAIAACLASIDSFTNGSATIGMGSVRNVDEAKMALDAGSQFIVSPIISFPVIEYCRQQNVVVCPGALTPTEMYTAHEAGANIIKVFPARHFGPDYIKDVLAPMPFLKLMPTGGIDLGNVGSYFAAGAVGVGVGGQFVDKKAIASRDWAQIGTLAERFVEACS
jgi:2-dehydro-3-deoxyphosphogluconate aldolase / (4S)-4-hydroxy-2-oxoglutarate aldolase